jgi:hypothetical protein
MIFVTYINKVTSNAGAKYQTLLKKLASKDGLLNHNSHLAAALDVTKLITIIATIFITYCCAS